MQYPIFQAGYRVRIISYGPFRGLIRTIRIVDTIVDLVEPFCFYLIDLESAQTKEPVWFEYEDVEPVSSYESDYLISACHASKEVISMLVVLGLVPLFVVIAIVWPIVAITKQRSESTEYTYTACVAVWYAQIMAMLGIVIFTAGIGYLFRSLIGYLNISYSYGPMSLPILGTLGRQLVPT